jgi:uncharacterized integral membrane protein
MAYSSENRPASPGGAPEPPTPPLSPDLRPPPSASPDPVAERAAEPVAERGTGTRRLPANELSRTEVPRTRTSAVWFGVWAGAAVLILLIIFVAQNTASVEISFLGLSGQISLALALLIAGVGGAIIAMAVAAARILQLRRLLHRRR